MVKFNRLICAQRLFLPLPTSGFPVTNATKQRDGWM
jgi:hypothetical protein